MSKEGWLIFRGKLVTDPNIISDIENFDVDSLQEVVEIVKGDLLSKTYIKLKESPLFHPNISYGDIMKVKPATDLSDKVTVLEFSGIEHSDFDAEDDSVKNLGTSTPQISPGMVDMMKNFDSKIRPMINDKFKEGLVFEPVSFVSHGSYKINVAYDADDNELNKMREYFKNKGVHFQTSSAKKLGSVAFGTETKFKNAVKCLESAHWITNCYLAFKPDEFPQIEFSPDLIPGGGENEDED